jgi:staphyloferrin B synthase
MALLAADPRPDSHETPDRAAAEVVHDLMDALLNDGLVELNIGDDALAARLGTLDDGESWATAAVSSDGGRHRRLVFRVRPAMPPFPRPWRFSRGPVLLVDLPGHVGPAAGDASVPLDAAGVVEAIARPSWAALDLVTNDLTAAAGAVAEAAEAAPRVAGAVSSTGLTSQAGEQLAALRDRPFHPLGRHKRGWSRDDAARWGPHAGRPFGLAWWAVPRAALAAGEACESDHADPAVVLQPADRERLDTALARSGAGDDCVVLPVHPWQARHLGGPRLGAVPLSDELGAFRATASLRTLVPAGRPGVHLKLPLAVATLGAGRQLPVRYLRNGDRAQRLLAAVSRHPALSGRVHVCDETAWWTALGPDRSGPDSGEAPVGEGELGYQLRRYPAPVADDPGIVLVPLGALGVTVGGRAPALAALAGRSERGERSLDRDSGSALLSELTAELVRLAVVGLAHGVMPELHGQNVVVVVRHREPRVPGESGRTGDGHLAGLVLRDHDAVRIHPAWLRAAGLPDPGYVVDGRTPNTLVAASPAGLLAWFQMLAVHLGLFPVVQALAVGAGLAEADGWRAIAASTAACLDDLSAEAGSGAQRPGAEGAKSGDTASFDLSAALAAEKATVTYQRALLAPAVDVARRQLLDDPGWPVKLTMGPLLERGDACGTSMPSAIGTTANPLRDRVR